MSLIFWLHINQNYPKNNSFEYFGFFTIVSKKISYDLTPKLTEIQVG